MGIDGILNLYTQQIVRFQAEELRNICFPFFFFFHVVNVKTPDQKFQSTCSFLPVLGQRKF